jgi:hypothetical protein
LKTSACRFSWNVKPASRSKRSDSRAWDKLVVNLDQDIADLIPAHGYNP